MCGHQVCARGNLLREIARHSGSPEQERAFVLLQLGLIAAGKWTAREVDRWLLLSELWSGDKPTSNADDDPGYLRTVTP